MKRWDVSLLVRISNPSWHKASLRVIFAESSYKVIIGSCRPKYGSLPLYWTGWMLLADPPTLPVCYCMQEFPSTLGEIKEMRLQMGKNNGRNDSSHYNLRGWRQRDQHKHTPTNIFIRFDYCIVMCARQLPKTMCRSHYHLNLLRKIAFCIIRYFH